MAGNVGRERSFQMSTLNSSSTLVQLGAAYADNASHAEDNSVAKARAFVKWW